MARSRMETQEGHRIAGIDDVPALRVKGKLALIVGGRVRQNRCH